MITASTKIKRSTKPYYYQGQTVYVYRQKDDGSYVISSDRQFKSGFNFPDVESDELEQVAGKPPVLTPEERAERGDLNDFFRSMEDYIPFNCQECGKPLYAATTFFKRGVTCHIFPKAEFESIKTNPDNIFYLGFDLIGVCNDHDRWDKMGAENRTKMKVYAIALERLELLKPFLSNHEKQMANKYLNIK